jgi:hypothetical protein
MLKSIGEKRYFDLAQFEYMENKGIETFGRS